MKIFLFTPKTYNQWFRFDFYLKKGGHVVETIIIPQFEISCNYWKRKIYKLTGNKKKKEMYYRRWNIELREKYKIFRPDIVLITNGDEMMEWETLQYFKNSKLIRWFFDGLQRYSTCKELGGKIGFYDKIFVFESADVSYLLKNYNIKSTHVSVGYDKEIYYPEKNERDVDIAFVGSYCENRISILRFVAQYAKDKKLNLKIFGPLYDNRHIWKKWRFIFKEPVLSEYIDTRILAPVEVADLYRKTKICLNIHFSGHKGMNPRTFDILGTKSFEILDRREEYSCFEPNVDFVVYEDEKDLLEKIEYYLIHENERELIAYNGYKKILNSGLDMEFLLSKVVFQ